MEHAKKRSRSWTDDQLRDVVVESTSMRMVIKKLGLVPAGGNYDHIKRIIGENQLDIKHFTGKGWNVGLKFVPKKAMKLDDILVLGRPTQSHKLRQRLIKEGIKKEKCEICSWQQMSVDGRIPVELDHINGNKNDNRIRNLRILCPNCHSLQLTHRGKNRNNGRMA